MQRVININIGLVQRRYAKSLFRYYLNHNVNYNLKPNVILYSIYYFDLF